MSEQDSAGKVLKFVKGIGAPTFKKSQDVYKEWARSYDKVRKLNAFLKFFDVFYQILYFIY